MAKELRTITVRPSPDIGMRPGPFTYYVVPLGDGKVRLSRYADGKFGPVMPAASVKHFIDDLGCVVRLPPTSGDPHVDAVLSGRGKCLGKGDDGLVFRVGDAVVKVGTTVPYQPENQGHLSPAQAIARLQAQVSLANRLADQGIDGVQRAKFVRHMSKGFAVKPYVEIPGKFTREQLDAVQNTMIAMHRAGVALRDSVQAGIDPSTGRPVLYDTGKAEVIPAGNEKFGRDSMVELDMSRLREFYAVSEQPFVRLDFDEGDRAWRELKDQIPGWLDKPVTPAFAERAIKWTSAKRRKLALVALEGGELAKKLALIDADERWEIGKFKHRDSEAGFARLEPLVFVAGGAVGFVVAPRLNARITVRPLGRYVPPSAAASVGAIVAGALAHRGGYRKTAAAAIGVGVGLAVGTVAGAKQRGGLLSG